MVKEDNIKKKKKTRIILFGFFFQETLYKTFLKIIFFFNTTMTKANKDNPHLWKQIVSKIKSETCYGTKAGQWSARKAQAAVKRYKNAGGGYEDDKDSSNSLHKWTKQDWRTKSGLNSSDTDERYLPAKAIKSLSDKEYILTSEKKRGDSLKGKQFSKQPKSIAKKIKKFRK